ncbi:SDR family NAD(P)-dependent oxidoreductase [bacterium]|nr:SDR family NAD(P)-dependent oxidoreductase [bacterium]
MTNDKELSVFITGGTGFVGKHIVNRLIKEGYHVFILARRTSNVKDLNNEKITIVNGTINDREAIETALSKVDMVIHAAATMSGPWDYFEKVTIKGTELLLDLCQKYKIKRLIHISSCSVYSHSTMGRHPVFHEDDSFEAKKFTYYSKSKIEAEKLVWKSYQSFGLPVTVLRPGVIYGPGGPIFPASTGLALSDNSIIRIGNGKGSLPIAYVENVADSVLLCLRNSKTVGKCYNLTEDEKISRNQYLKLIKKNVNPNLKIIKIPYWFMFLAQQGLKFIFGLMGKQAPMGALNLRIYKDGIIYSNTLSKEELRSEPYVAFDESIKRTMNWHKERRTPGRLFYMKKETADFRRKRKPLQVGIIGCGGISEMHLSILSKMEKVNICAAADVNEQRGKEKADQYNIGKFYNDYKEMIDNESLDVVHILTPPQTHYDIALFAMEKRCHVFIEKPFSLNLKEAEGLFESSQKNRVKICADFNHLYDDVMVEARQIISSGAIGRVSHVECWYGVQLDPIAEPYNSSSFWGYKLPGSLYQDFLPHPLYIMTDLMDDIKKIKAIGKFNRVASMMKTDELRILAEGEETTGALNLSLTLSPRYQFTNIYGTAGKLHIDFLNQYCYTDNEISLLPRTVNRFLNIISQGKKLKRTGYRNFRKFLTGKFDLFSGANRLIQLFYNSLLYSTELPIRKEDILQNMQLMDELWAMLRENGEL